MFKFTVLDIQQTTALICSDLELDLPFEGHTYSEDELRNWLANIIARLLHEDSERLFGILYRLDIPESRAIAAFSLSDAPALALADLVIERELQKIKTRRQYKEWQEQNPEEKEAGEDVELW